MYCLYTHLDIIGELIGTGEKVALLFYSTFYLPLTESFISLNIGFIINKVKSECPIVSTDWKDLCESSSEHEKSTVAM